MDLLLSNISDNHAAWPILIDSKCSMWYCIDKKIRMGIEHGNIATSAGYSQMINNSTYFVMKHPFTFIYLFIFILFSFTLTTNCGIEKSVNKKCHQNVIYGALKSNVLLHPTYYREVWDYKHSNNKSIQKDSLGRHWRTRMSM